MGSKTGLMSLILISVLVQAQPDFEDSESLSDSHWPSEEGWDIDEHTDIPVVLTATRLRQSQLDTPASVTIIDSELIERMGVRNIEEIFRMVPGMLVANDGVHGGKQTTVTYHGTQVAEHRRLQVLIDGRSVYRPALPSVPRVSWTDLPLAVEDIQRIEVIRGPNSAAYGANSYLAIINILTKKPEDVEGHRAKLTQGTNGIHDYYISTSGRKSRAYWRATVAGKADKGFDLRYDRDLEDEVHHRDSRDLDFINIRVLNELSPKLALETQVGYKTGTNQQRPTESRIDYLSDQDLDVDDTFVWARLNHHINNYHTMQYQAYYQYTDRNQEWRTCAGVLFGQSENDSFCADANQNGNEARSDFEIQDTFTWNKSLRTVAGIRLRQEEVESETFLGDTYYNKTRSIFANIEYKITPESILNIGASWEDEEGSEDFIAPRLAFNQHIGSNQVVRFIYSEAVRTPNIYELNGQGIYVLRNVESSFIDETEFIYPSVQKFDNDLSHEKIRSHEISYFALIDDGHWQLDAKWFYDELTDLISEGLGVQGVMLTNDTSFVLEGFEAQIKWIPRSSDEIYTSYAYINTKNEKDSSESSNTVAQELRLMAQHSGSVSWIHTWSFQTHSSLSYFWVDQWNYTHSTGPFNFERIDANISHQMSLSSNIDLRLSATIEYRIDGDPLLWNDNVYKNNGKYFVSAELMY